MIIEWLIIITMIIVTFGLLGTQIAIYVAKSEWLRQRRLRKEYPDLCKGMWGEGKPINKEWRDEVLKETEILKESEDRFQEGEDEIAETFDSADEAIKALATTDIPPATKKAYEALKRNNYENPGKEPPFWPNDY